MSVYRLGSLRRLPKADAALARGVNRLLDAATYDDRKDVLLLAHRPHLKIYVAPDRCGAPICKVKLRCAHKRPKR